MKLVRSWSVMHRYIVLSQAHVHFQLWRETGKIPGSARQNMYLVRNRTTAVDIMRSYPQEMLNVSQVHIFGDEVYSLTDYVYLL